MPLRAVGRNPAALLYVSSTPGAQAIRIPTALQFGAEMTMVQKSADLILPLWQLLTCFALLVSKSSTTRVLLLR